MFRLLRRLTALFVVGVVLYGLATFGQVWWTARQDQTRPVDAIVVLGAAQYDGRPSPVLRARLDHAADLYRRNLADTVVVTGGRRPGDPTRHTEASASADYLARQHGIPQDDILRENRGANSWQSLASAANELRKRDKEEVLLVSDPFHSARIKAMAGELGLRPYLSPTRTSPIGGTEEMVHMARETAAVAVGRIIGFRQLMGIERVRQEVQNR